MDTGILLESGTNELEILEFTVGGNSYGINVAKCGKFCHIRCQHRCQMQIQSRGIFMPRDEILLLLIWQWL